MNEKRSYTLLVDLVTDGPGPDERTLAETIEKVLESYPGIFAATVTGVEGDATHASAVLARLFTVHKHKH